MPSTEIRRTCLFRCALAWPAEEASAFRTGSAHNAAADAAASPIAAGRVNFDMVLQVVRAKREVLQASSSFSRHCGPARKEQMANTELFGYDRRSRDHARDLLQPPLDDRARRRPMIMRRRRPPGATQSVK